jgi:hypothetical protein
MDARQKAHLVWFVRAIIASVLGVAVTLLFGTGKKVPVLSPIHAQVWLDGGKIAAPEGVELVLADGQTRSTNWRGELLRCDLRQLAGATIRAYLPNTGRCLIGRVVIAEEGANVYLEEPTVAPRSTPAEASTKPTEATQN